MEEDDESIFAMQPTNSMGKGNGLGYEQAENKETYNLLLASCDGGLGVIVYHIWIQRNKIFHGTQFKYLEILFSTSVRWEIKVHVNVKGVGCKHRVGPAHLLATVVKAHL